MNTKFKIAGFVLLGIGIVIGIAIKQDVGRVAQAQAPDAMPLGRTPSAIVDGQYPASYFPNTELLGAA